VRGLALGGAELVLVPTALPESEHAAFIAERVVPVRAFENQVCVVYANHAGSDGRFVYAGRSCIAMPDGSDAARAGRHEAELILADYDPARFADSREANPYLADRRAELF
jgi:5-aminopentanamidase